MSDVFEPELLYALHPLPPGRHGFRRWRWELWHGAHLLATGWRTSERHAERAIRAHASRFVHRRLGLHPLRPDAALVSGGFGGVARLDCGPVELTLRPRGWAELSP